MPRGKFGRKLVMVLKLNRKVAIYSGRKEKQEYVSIETLKTGQKTLTVWLKKRTIQNHSVMKARNNNAALNAVNNELLRFSTIRVQYLNNA